MKRLLFPPLSKEQTITRWWLAVMALNGQVLLLLMGVILPMESLRAENESPIQLQCSEIRIGVIQSLTGRDAERGKEALRGIELAAETLSTPELPIRLLIEDDHSESAGARKAFNTLILKKITAVIGPTDRRSIKAILPLARKAQIPILNSTATLSEGDSYLFSNSLSSEHLTEPFSIYLLQMAPKSALIVTEALPDPLLPAYRAALGKDRQVEEFPLQTSLKGSERALSKKLKAMKPDLVVLLLGAAEMKESFQLLSKVGFRGSIFSSPELFDYWKVSSNRSEMNGSCFPYPFEQLREEEAFVKRFRARYETEPLMGADSSYDAVGIIHHSFLRSVGGPVAEELRSTDYIGVVGQYRFTEEGSLTKGRASLTCIVKKTPLVIRK